MFEPIPHIINIDLANKINMYNSITIPKNDTGSRLFIFNVLNNSLAYDLTGTTAKIYFKKEDTNKVFQSCVIDDALNGKMSYLLDTQCLSYAGLVKVEVTIYGPLGQILTSVIFTFIVSDIIRDDTAIESTSEFGALSEAIVKVEGWDANFQAKYDGLEAEYAADLTLVKSELADMTNKTYTQIRNAMLNPTIVAFGDSNTRYYLGEQGGNGSVSSAYSAWIDRFCADYPSYYGSIVKNAGYPSMTLEWGLDNYQANVTDNNANIVIIGFGTNDIKIESLTMEMYISRMTTMIDRLLGDGIVPIILGIPWFSDAYSAMKPRIPIWNDALIALCLSKNVEFIDVYKMFLGEYADIWFNEITIKRHYSKIAQKVIAQEVFKRILKLNNITSFSPSGYLQELFNIDTVKWFENAGAIDFAQFTFDLDNFDVVRIPTGQSITVRCSGRYIFSFCPREVATARFSDASIGDVAIPANIDNGLYYPLKRVGGTTSAYIGTNNSVTITAIGGNLYIRKISLETKPSVYKQAVMTICPRSTISALPTNPTIGTTLFCNELMKEINFYGVGNWLDSSGYICVGTTADRTGSQSNFPKGFKFYDTTTSLRYRWNGVDTWVSF